MPLIATPIGPKGVGVGLSATCGEWNLKAIVLLFDPVRIVLVRILGGLVVRNAVAFDNHVRLGVAHLNVLAERILRTDGRLVLGPGAADDADKRERREQAARGDKVAESNQRMKRRNRITTGSSRRVGAPTFRTVLGPVGRRLRESNCLPPSSGCRQGIEAEQAAGKDEITCQGVGEKRDGPQEAAPKTLGGVRVPAHHTARFVTRKNSTDDRAAAPTIRPVDCRRSSQVPKSTGTANEP